MFSKAYRRFTGRPDAAAVDEPELPAGGGRWTTLDLVMLAWVAARVGPDLPGTREQLYDQVIDRELDRWSEVIEGSFGHRPTRRALRLAAACVALLSPTGDRLTEVLGRVLPAGETQVAPGEFAEALARLLPDDEPEVLRLGPDPIAEHLLLASFRPHDDLFRSCVDVISTDATGGEPWWRMSFRELLASEAGRFCDNLTRAGESSLDGARARAGELADAVLDRRVDLWPGAFVVALLRGGPFVPGLTRLGQRPGTPMPLRQVNEWIPFGHTELRELALTAAERTIPPSTDGDDQEHAAARARALGTLAVRQAEAGKPETALKTALDAHSAWRRLAEANPAAYLPDLAMSLNNLGLRLSELGRREEALAPTHEAATLYRRLAENNSAAYLPNLATSLNNLGAMLSQLGRREEALAPTQEATTLYRRLAEANPAAYLPNLAGALNNLGDLLSELGREAIDAIEASRQKLGPGPRAELRLALARWWASNDDPSGLLAVLPEAIADADTEPDPPRAARARRAVRAAAASTDLTAATGAPAWVAGDTPDQIIDAVNNTAAAPTWAEAAELLRSPDAADLFTPAGRQARSILSRLHSDNPAVIHVLDMLDQIDEDGLDPVLDQLCAAEAHRDQVRGWVDTPTWTASRAYLTTHPDLLADPRTASLLESDSDDPDVRRHLAIVRLAASLPLEEVYDLVVDPTDAVDAAYTAVDLANLDQLLEIWHAAPHLASQPFTGPYLAAILTVHTGGTATPTATTRPGS